MGEMFYADRKRSNTEQSDRDDEGYTSVVLKLSRPL